MAYSSIALCGLCLFLMATLGVLSVAYTASATNTVPQVGGRHFFGVADETGRIIADRTGKVLVSEQGTLVHNAWFGSHWTWKNASGDWVLHDVDLTESYNGQFNGFTVWQSTDNATWQVGDSVPSMAVAFSLNVMSGGLTAIMVAMVAFIALVSFNFFGSGESPWGGRSMVTIAFFSAVWALVSAMGVSALTSIPVFGWMVYLTLTFVYFLGVWGLINSGGSF